MQTNQHTEQSQFQGFWTSINLLNHNQRKEIVLNLLSDLPSQDRAIISLFYFENLTVNEIAEVVEFEPIFIQDTLSKLITSIRDIVQTSDSQVNKLLH